MGVGKWVGLVVGTGVGDGVGEGVGDRDGPRDGETLGEKLHDPNGPSTVPSYAAFNSATALIVTRHFRPRIDQQLVAGQLAK